MCVRLLERGNDFSSRWVNFYSNNLPNIFQPLCVVKRWYKFRMTSRQIARRIIVCTIVCSFAAKRERKKEKSKFAACINTGIADWIVRHFSHAVFEIIRWKKECSHSSGYRMIERRSGTLKSLDYVKEMTVSDSEQEKLTLSSWRVKNTHVICYQRARPPSS